MVREYSVSLLAAACRGWSSVISVDDNAARRSPRRLSPDGERTLFAQGSRQSCQLSFGKGLDGFQITDQEGSVLNDVVGQFAGDGIDRLGVDLHQAEQVEQGTP